jgi:co-chaperonin GroES (HSP10)
MSEQSGEGRKTPVRYIKPLGPRVLVRLRSLDAHTRSGLILPDSVKPDDDAAVYGEVVEVARAESNADGEPGLGANVSGVPLGALVLFPKDAGLRVPWDDKLRLIEVKSVFATVEEVAPAELQ